MTFALEAGETDPQRTPLALAHLNLSTVLVVHDQNKAAAQRRAAGMECAPDAVWEIVARQWAKSHVPGLQRMATPQEIAAFALVSSIFLQALELRALLLLINTEE